LVLGGEKGKKKGAEIEKIFWHGLLDRKGKREKGVVTD